LRPSLATALAVPVLFAGVNGICRHEFLTKTGFPRIHHEVGMMDASQALDGHRPQIFRSIHACTQIARELAPDANIWFWFDMNEPLGAVYNNVACTHWWSLRYINRSFPNLPQPWPHDHPARQPGRKIMVLSQDRDATEKAVASFHGQGIPVRKLAERAVGRAPIRFTVSVLEVLPADYTEYEEAR
jgi:hypothetical protein